MVNEKAIILVFFVAQKNPIQKNGASSTRTRVGFFLKYLTRAAVRGENFF